MPLYEYRCTKCKKDFELIVPKMDDSSKPCPTCGKKSKQIISTPSPFQWGQGSDWKK